MEETYKRLALKFGIPVAEVKEIYRSYWLFIKNKIEELPLKEIKTEEEFEKLKTCFSMKNLGKLACTKRYFKYIKKKYESSNEDKTNV